MYCDGRVLQHPRHHACIRRRRDTSLSVAHQTRFGLRLATALFSPSASAAATTNAAFSPLSLHVVLSLLAAGAGGGTRNQLVATLGDGEDAAEGLHALAEQMVQLVLADGSRAGGPHIAFANGVFVDSALKVKTTFEEVAAGCTSCWSSELLGRESHVRFSQRASATRLH